MLRNILGLIVGIAVAVVTVMLMQWLSHSTFPPPEGLDYTDTTAVNAHLASAPVAALVIVLASYLFATFDGVFIACLIGRVQPMIYALIIGVLMLAATASNLFMFRHPTWFSVGSIVGIIFSAWLATLLIKRIREQGSDAA